MKRWIMLGVVAALVCTLGAGPGAWASPWSPADQSIAVGGGGGDDAESGNEGGGEGGGGGGGDSGGDSGGDACEAVARPVVRVAL